MLLTPPRSDVHLNQLSVLIAGIVFHRLLDHQIENGLDHATLVRPESSVIWIQVLSLHNLPWSHYPKSECKDSPITAHCSTSPNGTMALFHCNSIMRGSLAFTSSQLPAN